MIARHPDKLRKSRLESLESQLEMTCGFSDIACKNQPIVRVARDPGERLPIGFVAKVKITYCV